MICGLCGVACQDAQSSAYAVLFKARKLRGVKIECRHYLRGNLAKIAQMGSKFTQERRQNTSRSPSATHWMALQHSSDGKPSRAEVVVRTREERATLQLVMLERYSGAGGRAGRGCEQQNGGRPSGPFGRTAG